LSLGEIVLDVGIAFFDVHDEVVVYHIKMKGKKVIVWGLGRSGEAAAIFCLNAGAQVLLVERDGREKIELLLQTNLKGAEFCEQKDLDPKLHVDEIIISPGISRQIPELRPFIQRNISVVNEIELAHRRWREESRGPIVAITGSNGKTTTVHMVHQLLEAHGKKVFLGGNVGIPFCEFFNKGLDAECAVLELSSFQLESLFEFHSEVRVILNLSFTHGERYKDLEGYGLAKLRLSHNPKKNDLFIVGEFEENALEVERASIKKEFQFLNIPTSQDIHQQLNSELDLEKFRPVGEHNLSNLWVAIKVCESLFELKTEVVQLFVENFQGPEHRLEVILKTDSRWILNDSKSTNWTSTLVALRACRFAPRPLALVLGGQKRGENDSILPYFSAISQYVDEIILIGESGQSIFHELKALNYSQLKYSYFSNLSEMAENCLTKKENLGFIFSPAFPSFDQYKNYEQRGADFKAIIKDFIVD